MGSWVDEIVSSTHYTAFKPRTKRDLFMDWPELKDVPSIFALRGRPKELLFVWWYANRTSPLLAKLVDDRKIIEAAMEIAWEGKATDDQKEKFLNHKWPKGVDAAIEDMRRIEPEVRLRSKILAQRLTKNLEAILSADFTKADEKPQSWSDRKQALDALDKAMDMLPKLRLIAEGDFGVMDDTEDEIASKEKPGVALYRAQMNESDPDSEV